MKKIDVLAVIDAKASDMKKVIANLKVSDGNKNTRNTQLYAKKKEKRTIDLLKKLVEQCSDDVQFDEATKETFVLLTTLSTERVNHSPVSCKAGDSILELLERYDGYHDINGKLQKYCEKNNLVMDFKTGTIVAK